MKLLLRTEVAAAPLEVWEGFTEELFVALKPPLVGLDLQRFDGCQAGGRVEMLLHFGLFKTKWTSRISEDYQSEQNCYFIDEAEGDELPFFLRRWKHKHRMEALPDGGTAIIDDIEFEAPLGLNLALWPGLWAQFAWRKPIYRKVFGKKRKQ